MAFLDFLFGSKPSVETQTLSTLSPQQQNSLEALLNQLTTGSGAGEERRFSGDVNVAPSDLSQLSLAGLEERALALSDPNRESDIFNASTDTLLKLLDFEGQQAGVDEFFNTTVRDPALKSFEETVLPAIGRDFGGSNFFGSERQQADAEAREDLLTGLTRSRADISFRADQANRDRALSALGIAPGIDAVGRGDTNELLSLLQAGEGQTGLAERNVSREFQQFLAEAGLDDTQIQQLLQSLNVGAVENVVTALPGTEGFLTNILSSFAGADRSTTINT
jgi:hypothetical protein